MIRLLLSSAGIIMAVAAPQSVLWTLGHRVDGNAEIGVLLVPKCVSVFDAAPNIKRCSAAHNLIEGRLANNRPFFENWKTCAYSGGKGSPARPLRRIICGKFEVIWNRPRAIESPSLTHNIVRRCLPKILDIDHAVWRLSSCNAKWINGQFIVQKKISSKLFLANFTSHLHGLASSQIGLQSKEQRDDKQGRARTDKPRLNVRILLHRLRSSVHALLGDKIVFLVLAGFGFAALAGLGGGFILDHYNRKRRKLGWVLLLISAPTGFFFVYLGTTL